MGDAADYSEIRYEGYGVNGIAIIVEALWGLGLIDLSRFRSTEPST